MPGLDRTGPVGQGPMTGQALGKCGKVKDDQRSGWFGSSSRKKGGMNAAGRGGRKGCGRGNGQGRGRN